MTGSTEINGLSATIASLRSIEKGARVEAAIAMGRAVTAIHADLVDRSFTAKRPESTGLFRMGGVDGLAVDKGHLRSSIHSRVFIAGDTISGAVGSNVPWLPIHEYGGTIEGKPWLRIPTKYAAMFGFIGRGFALKSRPRGPSTAGKVYRTFFRLTKSGALFLFVNRPHDGYKITPLYLLVRRVTMPARRMFQQTVERVAPTLVGYFESAVRLVLRSTHGS